MMHVTEESSTLMNRRCHIEDRLSFFKGKVLNNQSINSIDFLNNSQVKCNVPLHWDNVMKEMVSNLDKF